MVISESLPPPPGHGEHELALANVKLATEIEPETEVYKTELEVLEKAVKEAAEKAAADGTSE